jgi:hypothetical protein
VTIDEARANIGAGVVYRPIPGQTKDGVITSVNARFVFVHYWGDARPKATAPEQLTLLTPARKA